MAGKVRSNRTVRGLVDGTSESAIPEAERIYGNKAIRGWTENVKEAESLHRDNPAMFEQSSVKPVTEEEALSKAKQLVDLRRNQGAAREGTLRAEARSRTANETVVPKSELKPLATGKEPKLKADEAIRTEASKTLQERRSGAARRLAIRGGGEDRREALTKALAERKGAAVVEPEMRIREGEIPGIKLRSLGGVISAVAAAPSMLASAIDLQKSIKSPNPPTRAEGVRTLLGLPGEDSSLVRDLRKRKQLKEM